GIRSVYCSPPRIRIIEGSDYGGTDIGGLTVQHLDLELCRNGWRAFLQLNVDCMDEDGRVVVLVDMDCFYVQVEQRERPELWGKPTAVVQYNQWRKGGIIAVGYEARAFHVKRGMRGDDALACCPELQLVQVPVQRGKADLTKYRQASAEVFDVLSSFNIVVERASIDEAYLDLTELVTTELTALRANGQLFNEDDLRDTYLAISDNPHWTDVGQLVQWANEQLNADAQDTKENAESALRILQGCVLANRFRSKIFEITQFCASAGIASNKMLAKLACGLNKPNKQTLVLPCMIRPLFCKTRLRDVRMLGGKLGNLLANSFQVETMLQLRENVSRDQLVELVGQKTEAWLNLILDGIDREPIVPRRLAKSIGCSKNFPGKIALRTAKEVKHWLKLLSEELEERLTRDQHDNYRTAKSLAVGVRTEDDGIPTVSCSRHTLLRAYAAEVIAHDALALIDELNTASDAEKKLWKPSVTMLALWASRFEDTADLNTKIITDFFKPASTEKQSVLVKSTLADANGPTTSTVAEEREVNAEKYASDLKAMLGSLNLFKNFCSEKLPIENEHSNAIDKCEEAVTPAKALSDGEATSDSLTLGSEKSADEQSSIEGAAEAWPSRYLPQSLDDIPIDVWTSLPPDVRWELKWEMKSMSKTVKEAGSDSSANSLVEKKMGKSCEFCQFQLLEHSSACCCVVMSAEEVLAFGNCQDGQLGLGGIEENMRTATALPLTEELRCCREIICGRKHTVFLLDNGTLLACGNNDFCQLGYEGPRKKPRPVDSFAGSPVAQVACGDAHTVALTDDGHVHSWGSNESGQLGAVVSDSAKANCSVFFCEVNLCKIVQVACGSQHCLALEANGIVHAWGSNDFGQLGLGHVKPAPSPQPIAHLYGIPFSQIIAGSWHSFANSSSGCVYGWGKNSCGQLGVGDTFARHHPVLLKSLRSQRIVRLVCGEDFTSALSIDGQLFTFGSGTYGQLGHGNKNNEVLPKQVVELMGTKVLDVACGRCHMLALTKDKVYAFGLNISGQLGIPDVKDCCLVPQAVPCRVSSRVFAGGEFSFLLCLSKQSSTGADLLNQRCIVTFDLKKLKNLAENNPSEFTEYVRMVMSNLNCLNGSFLKDGADRFCVSPNNVGIDLDDAMECFTFLSEQCANTAELEKTVVKSLELSIIPSLCASPPGIEALRIYVILPWCHAFLFPDNYRNIVVPFACCFVALGANAWKIIRTWWQKLPVRHLNRVLKVFKQVVVHFVNLQASNANVPTVESSFRQSAIKYSLEVLSQLHQVNKKTRTIPFSNFYIDELETKVDIRTDYVGWLSRKTNNDFSFCFYPFVFNAVVKALLLQIDMAIQMQLRVNETQMSFFHSLFTTGPITPYLVLTVSRQNIVEDTIGQLFSIDPNDLKKPIKVLPNAYTAKMERLFILFSVQFIGEEADDVGGVKKEFFLLLFQELLNPKFGMFIEYSESRRIWFSNVTFEDPKTFQFIGILCGLAIYNGVIVALPFPLALYRKLLKEPVTVEDLKELSPTEGRSLEQLLDYEGNDFESVFSLAFQITVSVFGESKTIELKPNGADIPVTKENRQEFVDLYVDYKLNKSISPLFDAFSNGFFRVLTSHLVKFFQPEELMELVIGNEHYDWYEFEKCTEYRGEYWRDHPTIKIFWQVFHSLTNEQKKKFLLFLTGSDRIPFLGMSQIKSVMAKLESVFDRHVVELLKIFQSACDSVNPESLVQSSLSAHCNRLSVCGCREYELKHNVYIVAFGKAALSMCRGATIALGSHIVRGIASVPVGAVARSNNAKQSLPNRIAVHEGAYNNLPDQAAFETSRLVVDMVQALSAEDILLVLISGMVTWSLENGSEQSVGVVMFLNFKIDEAHLCLAHNVKYLNFRDPFLFYSGGGSALLPFPVTGVSLLDKQRIVDALSKRSASIFEINVVRHHLSILKGGGLLTVAPLPQIVALIISDVMSNELQYVASGPTVPCTSTPADAVGILKRYLSEKDVPENVWSLLASPTLPKKLPANPSRVYNVLIGDNTMALRAACEEAVRIGFDSFILGRTLSGEASTVGKQFSTLLHDLLSKEVGNVSLLRQTYPSLLNDCSNETLRDVLVGFEEALKAKRPTCLLWGGETTVNVHGKGRGGRNQELVLSFIQETLREGELLTKWTNGDNGYFMFSSLATDGQDGPTDAAGALFHSSQLSKVSFDEVNTYLANNDSYHYFKSHFNASCLVKVGLTETNVMDLVLLTLYPL
ncbi:hypothetical protein M514_06796, partial [Trichuris suis]